MQQTYNQDRIESGTAHRSAIVMSTALVLQIVSLGAEDRYGTKETHSPTTSLTPSGNTSFLGNSLHAATVRATVSRTVSTTG